MERNGSDPIDIVILWVDGNDPAWLEEKRQYQKDTTSSVHTFDYQEWDLLRYWFRGIEKNAPWVRNVFFVTWGHLPAWLNTAAPKLRIVNHKDYIPEKYLPTFSSHTIELNLHRIKGLAEHFVYFNDDMFLIKKTMPTDFFRNGLPCDCAVINPIAPANANCIAHLQLTTAGVINQHYQKHKVILDAPQKWFTLKYGGLVLLNAMFIPWGRFPGVLEKHLPSSLCKRTFQEVWKAEADLLDRTCSHRFRDFKTDVNQWIMKEWQIASNRFAPRTTKIGKLLPVKDQESAALAAKTIRAQKVKMVCVNDHLENKNGEKLMKQIRDSFQAIYPDQSIYEKW